MKRFCFRWSISLPSYTKTGSQKLFCELILRAFFSQQTKERCQGIHDNDDDSNLALDDNENKDVLASIWINTSEKATFASNGGKLNHGDACAIAVEKFDESRYG